MKTMNLFPDAFQKNPDGTCALGPYGFVAVECK